MGSVDEDIGIVTSESKDSKDSEGCEEYKGPIDVSVRGIFLPFPLDPRAIIIVISIFTCCLAEKKWNKALIEADESLIVLLSKYDASILEFVNALVIVI